MGADIHLWVEKKIDNKWEVVEGINSTEIEWYENALKENEEKGSLSNYNHLSKEYLLDRIEQLKKPSKQWLYDGRNYNLFAILADVRNGRGFAGRKTGEGFNPISEPKGVPSDASSEYLGGVEYWNGDGHSHSYLTLSELKSYDWDQETTLYGVVSEDYYKELKTSGEAPTSYSGGVFGGNIVTVEEVEMNHIIAGNTTRMKNKKYFVRMKWKEKYKDVAGSFYNHSIKQLEELSTSDDEDDMRIVFFFDN